MLAPVTKSEQSQSLFHIYPAINLAARFPCQRRDLNIVTLFVNRNDRQNSPAIATKRAEFGRHPTANQLALSKEKSLASCPAAECGKASEFEPSETRVFDIPLTL